MLYLSLLAATVTSQPDYQLANLILMGIYVLLTLALAGVALWSVFITRAALRASSEQSRKALEASERQSKAAIEAVNKQIEASEKQAQEALYNQLKPVVVPISQRIEEFITPKGVAAYGVYMQNKGAGVAFNAFGVLGIKGLPDILCSLKMSFLVQDDEKRFYFDVQGEILFPYNMFEEIAIFPPVGTRLLVTYNDTFSNKYFAVFDYSEELGWKQVYEIRRVKQRLDELVIIRHKGE